MKKKCLYVNLLLTWLVDLVVWNRIFVPIWINFFFFSFIVPWRTRLVTVDRLNESNYWYCTDIHYSPAALACCVLFDENSAQWYLLMLLLLQSKESEMGQDSGTVTIVMSSRIPAFKGELLIFCRRQKAGK